MSLADRGLLQANQTDSPVGRFYRAQRQRGEVANLDGVTDLCVVALPGVCEPMGAKLCPHVGAGACGIMEEIGFVGFIEAMVWDSTKTIEVSRLPGAGLFPRILRKVMGQHVNHKMR